VIQNEDSSVGKCGQVYTNLLDYMLHTLWGDEVTYTADGSGSTDMEISTVVVFGESLS
jgi:hypothetical protein